MLTFFTKWQRMADFGRYIGEFAEIWVSSLMSSSSVFVFSGLNWGRRATQWQKTCHSVSFLAQFGWPVPDGEQPESDRKHLGLWNRAFGDLTTHTYPQA